MKAANVNHLRQMTQAEGLLVTFENYGSNFNPPTASISLQALKDNLAMNQQLLQDVRESNSLLEIYQNSKNRILAEVSFKVRQIESIVSVIEVADETRESVKAVCANFKGKPKKAASPASNEIGNVPPSTTDGKAPNAPTSKRFAERRIEWLSQLVDYLSREPAYNPHEPELTIAGLKSYIEASKEVLALWHKEKAKLETLRLKREEQFRSEKTGLVTLFRNAVTYARTIYPRGSKEHKDLMGMDFRRR